MARSRSHLPMSNMMIYHKMRTEPNYGGEDDPKEDVEEHNVRYVSLVTLVVSICAWIHDSLVSMMGV